MPIASVAHTVIRPSRIETKTKRTHKQTRRERADLTAGQHHGKLGLLKGLGAVLGAEVGVDDVHAPLPEALVEVLGPAGRDEHDLGGLKSQASRAKLPVQDQTPWQILTGFAGWIGRGQPVRPERQGGDHPPGGPAAAPERPPQVGVDLFVRDHQARRPGRPPRPRGCCRLRARCSCRTGRARHQSTTPPPRP